MASIPAEPTESDGFVAWLRARTPAPPARAEFRQRARLQFLSLAASSAVFRPAVSRRRRLAVLALAAAAILAVTFFLPQPVRWRVRLDGVVRFEGADFGLEEEDRLASELEGAGLLETTSECARIAVSDELELELQPGAALQFPPLPTFDGLEVISFELTRGELFVRTASGYAGNPVVVRTALGEVSLQGTVVGVIVDDLGLCVCVAESQARVTTAFELGLREVPERMSYRVFRDAAMAPKLEGFGSAGAESEHTRPLVEFAGASWD